MPKEGGNIYWVIALVGLLMVGAVAFGLL